MDNYLKSDDDVLLLLGDPGAGKSLFAWYSTQLRLNQYQKVLKSEETTETPWLPIVIELKNYRLSDLTDLLSHHLKNPKTCHLTDDEQAAIWRDRDPRHKILLVLDGFDELKQEDYGKKDFLNLFEDCFKTCGAAQAYKGQIKLMVTCRVRHLADTFIERQYFGRGTEKRYRRRVLLPFSIDKITRYLEERTLPAYTSNPDQTLSLLPLTEYQFVLEESPSIKEMVRNPFVLRLFVEALPELKKQGRDLNTIKRYDIYEAFVTQWFMREISRFNPAHRQALGISSERGDDHLVQQFSRYAGILAIQMYQHDALVVTDVRSSDEAFQVWSHVDKMIYATDLDRAPIKAELQAEYAALLETEKLQLEIDRGITDVDTYVTHKLPQVLKTRLEVITAFKITSPLKKVGDHSSFIHKSFYEFFLAQVILNTAGADKVLTSRVEETIALLLSATTHEARRIHHEPQALIFMEDRWLDNTTHLTPALIARMDLKTREKKQKQIDLIKRTQETLFTQPGSAKFKNYPYSVNKICG